MRNNVNPIDAVVIQQLIWASPFRFGTTTSNVRVVSNVLSFCRSAIIWSRLLMEPSMNTSSSVCSATGEP
jgi:hypothetical protein